MKEYNLSEDLKSVMGCFKERPYGIYIDDNEVNEYETIIDKLYKVNSGFLKKTVHFKGVQYSVTDLYENEINYLYEFLLLCENLLNKSAPDVNRFNEAKLRDLKAQNIVDFSEEHGNIKDIQVKSFNLLEDEYFNMRYKVNIQSYYNIENSMTEKSYISESDLYEITQAIQVLIAMNMEVPSELKIELSKNIDDKNKLKETINLLAKWLDENGEIARVNIGVAILMESVLKIINK